MTLQGRIDDMLVIESAWFDAACRALLHRGFVLRAARANWHAVFTELSFCVVDVATQ